MKLSIKSIIALAAMLLTTSVGAQDKFAITYQLDGAASSAAAAGTVVGSISGTTATLTVTPADGNYITKDQITVVKIISGNEAQDRTRNPQISTPVDITAADANADPSGVTTYTFEVTDAKYNYEVTANFLSRTDVDGTTVTTNQTSYTYTGEDIEPGITVKLPTGTTLTENKDYTIEYANNKNAGEGDIAITGIGLYKGTKTVKFTIAKAAATISFAEPSMDMVEGDENTNALSNTGDGTVTYTSSNKDVATVNENGLVSAVGAGDATITATVTEKESGNYTYATKAVTYTVNVSKKPVVSYGLWINETQVTEENMEDVLDQAHNEEMPLYVFNAKTSTLIVNGDQQLTTVIESRLPELKIYLMEVSKMKHVFYNNLGDDNNTGMLTFTCNGNFPGKLVVANTAGESAITGFSNVSYEWDMSAIEPDGAVYRNKSMWQDVKDENGNVIETLVADTVTIGQVITPLTQNKIIEMTKDLFIQKDEKGDPVLDEKGDPILADLSNFSTNKILITLNPDPENPDKGDGFDDSDDIPGIAIESTMNDNDAGGVADGVANEQFVPGGSIFAENFDGITFKLPAGKGKIIIDQIVDPGYEFHLRIGTDDPITLREGETGRVQAVETFDVDEPTYCYLYLVEIGGAGARGITRIGKRERAHGKIVSVGVSVSKAKDCNPASEASDGVIPASDDPKVEEGDDVITGITNFVIKNQSDSDNWYDLQGRQISQPTKKGLYIKNKTKIVIK